MSTHSILTHPTVEKLRRRRQELCSRLADLLEEWRSIREDINPKLLALYDDHFRPLELNIQQRTLEQEQLARREDLFRMKLERGEKLNEHTIRLVNSLVDREFQRMRRHLDEASGTGTPTSAPKTDGAEDLPKLYRAIVKKLHPDAAESRHNDWFQKFWNNAQEAYQNKNVERLRSIYDMVCLTEDDAFSDTASAEEILTQEIERLEGRIASEEKKLTELMNSEPYSLRDALNDPQWLAAHRRALEQELAGIEREIERHTAFLASILGDEWRQYLETPQHKESKSFQDEFSSSTYFNNR